MGDRYLRAATAVDPIDEAAARLATLPGFRAMVDELEHNRAARERGRAARWGALVGYLVVVAALLTLAIASFAV